MSRARLALVVLAAAPAALAQDGVPSGLAEALARAGVDARPAAWCSGEFRRGLPGGFAAALPGADGRGGRYVVVERDGRLYELGSYAGRPELACYTPAEARRLNETIAASETIQGQVRPAFPTVTVCGFVEETAATCWQYAPEKSGFVPVGEWVT